MRTPSELEELVEYGIVREVVRPLMSGKEAQVYLVDCGGVDCVAKVYKEAERRTFKHRADYTEGRRTRNSRDQRAMAKRSQHGKRRDEEAWRNQEVDMIYRLRDAGVTVPEPLNFASGVLVMELVKDADGQPAPRLGDLAYTPAEAKAIYDQLLREVVRMLCADVIHGDLSDFNVLMSAEGPVIIDFPQAIDATKNANARKLLLRDVENLNRFLARFAPNEPIRRYGEEMWSLYEGNRLEADTPLGGRYEAPKGKADTSEVMSLIEDAQRDAQRRQGDGRSDEDAAFDGSVRNSLTVAKTFRTVVDFTAGKENEREKAKRPSRSRRAGGKRRGRGQPRSQGAEGDTRGDAPGRPPTGPSADRAAAGEAAPKSRTRRRRRPGRGPKTSSAEPQTSTGKDPAAPRRPAKSGGDRPAAPTGGDAPKRTRRRRRRNRQVTE